MKIWHATLLIGAALLLPSKASACECEVYGDGSPRAMLHHAKVMFVGEVLEVRSTTESEREEGDEDHAVRFRVERYWKGIKGNEVTVYAYFSDCPPFSIELGARYVVYAIGKHLSITCTRTRRVDSAVEDLSALGKAKTPK